jgi:hypothetical protein
MSNLFLLAAVPAARGASLSSSLPGGHMFWVGLVVGLLVCTIPLIPFWLKMVALVVALGAVGAWHVSHGHLSPAIAPYVLVIAITLAVGLHYGRVRGLRHLGEFELANRRAAVPGRSRF